MSVARESLPFVMVLLGLGALTLWLAPWATALPLGLLLFVLWFFRDPERRSPDDPAFVLSPADGRILRATPERVSIFMNVFNVHVCRSPMAGRVRDVAHHPGRFLAAFRDEAPQQNERVEIGLDRAGGSLRFTLIAGLVARRIVCRIREGQELRAGERVGLIRFGSRVDVDLPQGAQPTVAVGDRVRAGETPLARLRQQAATPGSASQDSL